MSSSNESLDLETNLGHRLVNAVRLGWNDHAMSFQQRASVVVANSCQDLGLDQL